MLARSKRLWAALLPATAALAALGILREPKGPASRAGRSAAAPMTIELPALEERADPPAPPPEPPPLPPSPSPEPERIRAPEGPTTVHDLAKAGGWIRSLVVHHALPALPGPEAERARLEAALSVATNPVARQNIIFLGVLTLPAEVSRPWLRGLGRGGYGGDAEDALLALAFDGDPEARGRFAGLSRAASRARVHRLLDGVDDHERLGESGTDEARDVLRSYRAIEVLDRVPYFKITFHLAMHAGGADEWEPHPARTEDLDRELLDGWLARYPGHPGSDDMAVRLGRIETARGAHLDAARWYSRAATMPDQDLCKVAVEDLVAICELLLSPEELDRLAHEQGYQTRNRALVQYIRLRRMAAERGFDLALLHAEALGRDEPLSVLGHSWNHRYGAPVPKGLDSGVAPAPPDDPLRATAEPPAPFARPEGAPRPSQLPDWFMGWDMDDESRLDPFPERLQIDEAILMRQFRAWEAIATLERRAARERGGARADLLYKVAAIFYHEPHAIFPAYGEVCDFTGVFRHAMDGAPERFAPFARTSYALRRAIGVFERIEHEHPRYAAIDKVLYSKGIAWSKLTRYASDGLAQKEIRAAVDSLERCAAYCPRSPLADDALRAVDYWRRTRPDAFD